MHIKYHLNHGTDTSSRRVNISPGRDVISMGILEKHNLRLAVKLLIIVMIMVFAFSVSVTESFAAMPDEESGEGVIPVVPGTGTEEEINSYREERIEEIPFKTLYQYSSSLAAGETKVKTPGEAGTKRIVGMVLTKDGKIESREEISSEILRAPRTEVILVGSLSQLPEADYDFPPVLKVNDVSYDASVYASLKDDYKKASKGGKAVVEFALRYLGNPYVWGGSSLTDGTDCSGFVYSVFNSLGYDIPRFDLEYCYPVSVDEMLPGDVIAYPSHYAIYMGGGLEVGALNASHGICISPVGYVGEGYVAVRIAN